MYFCTQTAFRWSEILFRGLIFSVSVARGKWHFQLSLSNMYTTPYIYTIIGLYQSPPRHWAENLICSDICKLTHIYYFPLFKIYQRQGISTSIKLKPYVIKYVSVMQNGYLLKRHMRCMRWKSFHYFSPTMYSTSASRNDKILLFLSNGWRNDWS